MINIKKDSKLSSSVNLAVIQLCMFAIPLIATPYIVSRVGIVGYGKFIFFQTVMGILGVIGNYGFMQTGVRDVANATTLPELNREFSRIFFSKAFTFAVSALAASMLFLFDRMTGEWTLYSFSFLFLVVNFLDVSFVYQGIERLKDFVFANLVGNVIYLFALFYFIRAEQDYVYLPVVFCVPRILASGFSLLALGWRFGIRPVFLKSGEVAWKIRYGFSFFLTNVFSMVYTKMNVILLGVIANNASVGYYAIAEQVVFAYCAIQGKVSTVYQPQISSAFERNFAEGVEKARENLTVVLLMSASVFLFVEFFSFDILHLLFAENAAPTNTVMMIMAVNFIVLNATGVLGVQVLLSLYKDNELLKPTVAAALCNLVLAPVLIYMLAHTGAALSVVIVETGLLVYFYGRNRAYGINLLDRVEVKTLSSYVVTLLPALVLLKIATMYSTLNPVFTLGASSALFALYVLGVLRAFGIVDFRNRRIVLGHAHE